MQNQLKPTKHTSKTFFGFLIASFFLWILVTFSKDYKSVVFYVLDFKNIPQKNILLETAPKKMEFYVSASGFKLFWSKLFAKNITIDLENLTQKKNSIFYILPKNQLSSIQDQLISGLRIETILKDTLFLNVGLLTSKKVALRPDVDINFQIGYNLLGDVKITPDSIEISGPKNEIKNLSFLTLETLKLENINTDFSKEIAIVKPLNYKNIKLPFSSVNISGTVEKFTEGSIQIPFKIINLPTELKLTTLTENASVTYIVGLSNFSKISETSFSIVCDYEISEKNALNYLIPKVILQPDFVENVKIIPTKIDFLIQK